MKWQPIETAPRDGTPILVWDPTMDPRTTISGVSFDDPRYAIGYYRVFRTEHYGHPWGNRNHVAPNPTHWMPLPEPPK